MTTVAVIQSNYIPWKGYFDIINDVDLFVFYDDVQYTKNSWRNRNRIKTVNGVRWLTVPTGSSTHQLIHEVAPANHCWQRKHWLTIQQSYAGALYFSQYQRFFELLYTDDKWINLSELNQFLIKTISMEFLGSKVEFLESRELHPVGQGTERLVDLLQKVGATRYVSGPTARDYLEEERLAAAGIQLTYKDYSGYPEYLQSFPPFKHKVSIIDLLFHCGSEAAHYIWGWRRYFRDSAPESDRVEVSLEAESSIRY